jgi:glucoside 3-dehydrogenase (cytochrome c) hitch-hiker subunit
MNRRDALSRVALIFGGTVIGAEAFLAGCRKATTETASLTFDTDIISLLDEVGETILPTTASSPGAKAAAIGEFMKVMVTDCYDEKDQQIFKEGIGLLNQAADEKYGGDFMSLSEQERHDLLVELDKTAKAYSDSKKEDDPNHYFTMMKQLTLWGYFSSEVGATKALRYIEVPGRYEGCMDYKKGDKAWAI